MQTANPEYDEIQSACSDGKVLLLQDSSPLKNVESVMLSFMDNAQVFDKCQLSCL